MGVRVRRNRHGFLVLRIRHRGQDKWIGTKLRDDGPHGRSRRALSAKAVLIEEDLRRGRCLADALLDRIGSCPSRLLPEAERRLSGRASITVGEYYEGWIARQKPPLVRPTNAEKHRYYFEGVILPFWRDVPLVEVRGARLKEFQGRLFDRRVHGRPIKVKTARNIIDGHFRALLRDAREELDHLPLGDPFRSLRWPKEVKDAPDPFTPEERDRILEFYRTERPFWYPLVYFLFWTGLRPGEAAALRIADVDLVRGKISITKSRDRRSEGPPKTAASRREIALLPNVVRVLRTIVLPAGAGPDTYFFRNPEGGPVTTKWWPKKSWKPVLKKLAIRYRKFYATRHTLISWALTKGMNLKALAEYAGTSVEMIQRSYGRYLASDGLDPLVKALGGETEGGTEATAVLRSRLRRAIHPLGSVRHAAILRRLVAIRRAKAGTLEGTLLSKRVAELLNVRRRSGNENGPTGNRTTYEESGDYLDDAQENAVNPHGTRVSSPGDDPLEHPETSRENPSTTRKTGPGPVRDQEE